MNVFRLNDNEIKRVGSVYERMKVMIDARNQTYREFNDRTLVQYIDDSDKRINSYVEPKEVQGKEDWQANVALPTVRDKLKRIIAGFALTVPDQTIEARDESGDITLESLDRGDIAQKLVKASYTEKSNPVIDHFWESWECGGKGTIIVYDGYLKTKQKQKFIKSIDIESGKIEFDEREVNVDDRCISHIVPISEFYIPNYRVNDIQELQDCAWVKYYTEELFKYEFGHYPKAKYVKKSSGIRPDVDTFYHQDEWAKEDRAGKEKIEVIRYYNRVNDEYIIVANGIPILDAPLLWNFNGKKCYPFSKAILEPFTGRTFFYGKSLADILMGQYDLLNTYFNSVMDKGFKSINVPTLIGRTNQDTMDLEDDIIGTSTKIYVDDVNQVKPMPVEQVSQADVQMIQLLSRGIEDSSPSMPHLLQGKTATAREVVIAEENVRQLKAIYHEMLVDLWRQKFQLRLSNIRMNYPNPRKIYKDGKVQEVYRTFIIENTYLDKDLRERGTLAITFRNNLSDKEKAKIEDESSVIETAMEIKGIKYKRVTLDKDYLDGFNYKIIVIPDSVNKTSIAKLQVSIQEKLQILATFFPEILIANQEQYFEEFAEAYSDDPQKMLDRFRDLKGQAEQQAGPGAQPERLQTETGEPTGGLPTL